MRSVREAVIKYDGVVVDLRIQADAIRKPDPKHGMADYDRLEKSLMMMAQRDAFEIRIREAEVLQVSTEAELKETKAMHESAVAELEKTKKDLDAMRAAERRIGALEEREKAAEERAVAAEARMRNAETAGQEKTD